MLESGVDRIITQVVDPKMNHTFRPQIETAVHEFLSGDRKEESTPSSNPAPSEQTETQEPTCASGPRTPWDVFFLLPEAHLVFAGLRALLRWSLMQFEWNGEWRRDRGCCFHPLFNGLFYCLFVCTNVCTFTALRSAVWMSHVVFLCVIILEVWFFLFLCIM